MATIKVLDRWTNEWIEYEGKTLSDALLNFIYAVFPSAEIEIINKKV